KGELMGERTEERHRNKTCRLQHELGRAGSSARAEEGAVPSAVASGGAARGWRNHRRFAEGSGICSWLEKAERIWA
ncbi:Hypothetical predicted protein, partial [Marmota monax]